MGCYSTLLSRFHISVALVLATVAYLAVPERAFADDPNKCASNCETEFGTGNPHYWSCIAGCCDSDDPGDPNCCSLLCDEKDPDCVSNCLSLLTIPLCCDVKGALNCPLSGPGCPARAIPRRQAATPPALAKICASQPG